ncbi:MAG: hypothetical protein F6K54_08430 [Okeania sp. SIO3B5]|uniref:hypothetical protein n=1 Tax=Okeania sp. SIO3B5 TaxID=2607811 RepID=UPI0013FF8924|nr:hypothetical protein [Okeania sp. SIO3B5]NEO53103.1 hypothetical protein [Okeania sp. SIO3B5]
MNSLTNQITLSQEEKQFFSDHGFIKLKKLLTTEAVDGLRKLISNSNAMKAPPEFYSGEISKMGYDIEEAITRDIYSSANFKNVLNQLTNNRGAAFIQGIGFELDANQKGFHWHHDILSFCCVMPEDLAYTLWIPLDPINIKEQHGGLSYVSHKVCSARHYFDIVYQLVQQENISEFSKTEEFKNWDFQYASPVETFVLDNNKVEDDFEVGDALLLGKFVWHKSCSLKEGELPSRKAYVMRFVDCQARYSKVSIEGTYSLLNSSTKDLDSDIGYQLGKFLQDGDIISDNLANFKKL